MTLDDLGDRLFASTNEVAAILDDADPRTIRRMIADGTIPARKNGSRHIIPVAWLREYVGAPSAIAVPAAPDLDELAERVADRVIARLGHLFAALAAAEMTVAGPATGPATIAADHPIAAMRGEVRAQRTACT